MIELWAFWVNQYGRYALNDSNIHFLGLNTASNNIWDHLKQAQSKANQLWPVFSVIFR